MTRDRFRGALLGCLLGDAFGSVLEGVSRTDARLEALIEQRRLTPQPWRYTDDTEMALGVARSLIESGGRLDGDSLMEAWASNYEPARGYGKGMKLALRAWQSGGDAASAAWDDGSRGAGAAARVVAIGLAHGGDLVRLEEAARVSAALTHKSDVAIDAAMIQARAVATALATQQLEPARFIDSVAGGGVLAAKVRSIPSLLSAPLDVAIEALGNGVMADEALPLALYAFLRWAPSFEDVVVNTARCGGDVDTIAAMSGALTGALVGASAMPELWLPNAEGVELMNETADALYELETRSGTKAPK